MTQIAAIPPPVRSVLIEQFALALCGAVLAFPLLGYAYLGAFTRHVADDYCAGRNLFEHGLWGSQVWTYQHHSGRFFSYFVRIGAEFLGRERIVPFLAAILLIAWLAATTWSFLQYAKFASWKHSFFKSLVLSELLIVAMLRTAPDPGESFYWEAGSLTYTLPIIIFSLYLGVVFYYLRKNLQGTYQTLSLLLAGLICFCSAGTSETNAAMQCMALLGAILICKWMGRSSEVAERSLPVMYSGFLGSLVSSFLVVVAPGNAVREGAQRKVLAALPLAEVVKKGFLGGAMLIVDFVHYRPLAAIVLLAVPAVLVRMQSYGRADKLSWRKLIGSCLMMGASSFALIVGCTIPGVYALAALPPYRARFVAHWILLGTLLLGGTLLGKHWPRTTENAPLNTVVLCFVLSLVLFWVARSAGSMVTSVRQSQRFSSEWDALDAQIRTRKGQGEKEILLPWNDTVARGGNVDGAPWLSADPNFWVNTCTADYYGIQSLRVSKHPPEEGR